MKTLHILKTEPDDALAKLIEALSDRGGGGGADRDDVRAPPLVHPGDGGGYVLPGVEDRVRAEAARGLEPLRHDVGGEHPPRAEGAAERKAMKKGAREKDGDQSS